MPITVLSWSRHVHIIQYESYFVEKGQIPTANLAVTNSMNAQCFKRFDRNRVVGCHYRIRRGKSQTSGSLGAKLSPPLIDIYNVTKFALPGFGVGIGSIDLENVGKLYTTDSYA